jgi:hypothetical protein
MKVRLTMPTKDGKRLKDRVIACAERVEEDDMTAQEWEVVSARERFRSLALPFPSNQKPKLIVLGRTDNADRPGTVQSPQRVTRERDQGTREDGEYGLCGGYDGGEVGVVRG